MKDFLNEKCVICGVSMKVGATMVFSKNKMTVCHSHQNYRKDTTPGSHNCEFSCCFTEPFGFVPEDGCPIHDK